MASTFTAQYRISHYPKKRDRRFNFCEAKIKTAGKGFLKRKGGPGGEKNFF